MTPEAVLGPAMLEAVRQLIRDEIRSTGMPVPTTPTERELWITPPEAELETRLPVKTIRAWAKRGIIEARSKNRSPTPKQFKYLVNVDQVREVARRLGLAIRSPAVGTRPSGENLQDKALRLIEGRE